MKCVSLPNAEASALVWGRLEVINRPRIERHRGDLLIHAGGVRPRPYGTGDILGLVEVTDCVEGWECQLEGAVGPRCLLVRRARVFLEPVPHAAFLHLFDVVERVVAQSLAEALPPREAASVLDRQRLDAADANEVQRPTPDGWTGD